jgi:hypothetical protein
MGWADYRPVQEEKESLSSETTKVTRPEPLFIVLITDSTKPTEPRVHRSGSV